MDKEKYNSEGYYDPTCYEALLEYGLPRARHIQRQGVC